MVEIGFSILMFVDDRSRSPNPRLTLTLVSAFGSISLSFLFPTTPNSWASHSFPMDSSADVVMAENERVRQIFLVISTWFAHFP